MENRENKGKTTQHGRAREEMKKEKEAILRTSKLLKMGSIILLARSSILFASSRSPRSSS